MSVNEFQTEAEYDPTTGIITTTDNTRSGPIEINEAPSLVEWDNKTIGQKLSAVIIDQKKTLLRLQKGNSLYDEEYKAYMRGRADQLEGAIEIMELVNEK